MWNGGIYIDSNRCKSKQYPYMFYLGGIDPIDEAIKIHSDFTTWLARLLDFHGEEYWVWDYDDRLTFKS